MEDDVSPAQRLPMSVAVKTGSQACRCALHCDVCIRDQTRMVLLAGICSPRATWTG